VGENNFLLLLQDQSHLRGIYFMIIKLEHNQTKETVKGDLSEIVHFLTEKYHSPNDEYKVFFGDDDEYIAIIDIHTLMNALTITFLELKKEQKSGK
jgi:hypothetical protein